MKKSFIILFILLVLSPFVNTQTVDGQFIVMTNDGANYSVKVQIKLLSGLQNLGNATIRFSFNETNLSFPVSPVEGTNYIFHNFQGGDYSSTVSRPNLNTVSINIAYISGSGTTVNSSYIDVATINFTTLNSAGNSNLQWGTRELYAIGSSTPWGLGSWPNLDTSPLPVELSSFTASAKQNVVNLKWETATEVNNYGFDIERSKDEKLFEKVGFVKGHGNSNSPKSYAFSDKTNIFSSKVFYRLKQIDLDGSYSYSNVINVSLQNPESYELFQNFPNPFNPVTRISFQLPTRSNVAIKVFNIIGEQVAELLNEVKDPGFYEVNFDGSNLPSGLYIYTLNADGLNFIKKMMLVK